MRAISKNTRKVTALTLAAALVVAVYLNWQYARAGVTLEENAVQVAAGADTADEASEPKILVSACLAGIPCRYDGKSTPVPEIVRLVEEGLAVPFCPECAGGLETPRTPAEISGGRVLTRDGRDVTEAFEAGAVLAAAAAKEHGIVTAVLKSKSPSCGSGEIYDGSFTGRLVPGEGVTARALREAGINVITEKDFVNEYE